MQLEMAENPCFSRLALHSYLLRIGVRSQSPAFQYSAGQVRHVCRNDSDPMLHQRSEKEAKPRAYAAHETSESLTKERAEGGCSPSTKTHASTSLYHSP